MRPLLLFLDDMILFRGPLGALDTHRHAAPAIICVSDGVARIDAGGKGVSAHAAYVPPNLLHAPDFSAGCAGVLYLLPGSVWARRACAGFTADTVTSLDCHGSCGALVTAMQGSSDSAPTQIALILDDMLPRCDRAADSRIEALLDGQAGIALSPSRLRHLFVQETQAPFRRYRVWRMLETAVAAAFSGMSLTAAAQEAGFADSAHLSRAFRNMFGLPPSHILAAAPEFRDLRQSERD